MGDGSTGSAGTVYDLYREGCRLLDDGDAAGAIEPLERAVAMEPTSTSVREAFARACFATSRIRMAILYDRAAALEATWRLIRETNSYLEANEPWKMEAGPAAGAGRGGALEARRIGAGSAGPALAEHGGGGRAAPRPPRRRARAPPPPAVRSHYC